jgi:hypothetical protein
MKVLDLFGLIFEIKYVYNQINNLDVFIQISYFHISQIIFVNKYQIQLRQLDKWNMWISTTNSKVKKNVVTLS